MCTWIQIQLLALCQVGLLGGGESGTNIPLWVGIQEKNSFDSVKPDSTGNSFNNGRMLF